MNKAKKKITRDKKQEVIEHNKKFEESLASLSIPRISEERRSRHPGVKVERKPQPSVRGGISYLRNNKHKQEMTEQRYRKRKAHKVRMEKHQARLS